MVDFFSLSEFSLLAKIFSTSILLYLLLAHLLSLWSTQRATFSETTNCSMNRKKRREHLQDWKSSDNIGLREEWRHMGLVLTVMGRWKGLGGCG